jgi:hypothetical protein
MDERQQLTSAMRDSTFNQSIYNWYIDHRPTEHSNYENMWGFSPVLFAEFDRVSKEQDSASMLQTAFFPIFCAAMDASFLPSGDDTIIQDWLDGKDVSYMGYVFTEKVIYQEFYTHRPRIVAVNYGGKIQAYLNTYGLKFPEGTNFYHRNIWSQISEAMELAITFENNPVEEKLEKFEKYYTSLKMLITNGVVCEAWHARGLSYCIKRCFTNDFEAAAIVAQNKLRRNNFDFTKISLAGHDIYLGKENDLVFVMLETSEDVEILSLKE